jgi:hypothetical protein
MNKEWFLARVGEIVFRDTDGCNCPTCKNIIENGILIRDEEHAEYMFEIQNELGAEGIELNYRDTKIPEAYLDYLAQYKKTLYKDILDIPKIDTENEVIRKILAFLE